MSEFNKWVNREEIDINFEVFKKRFSFQRPSDMLKAVYTTNDKNKNSNLVNVIKSGLSYLKNEIEDMGEEEKQIEKPNEITDVVERYPEFNKQKQQGKDLKILTPSQMLSRSPITLAQLKAGNTSEKLKNEIRQLLYSLCRSKKTSETTLQKFDWHYLKIETIFMNTENSKTNEPHMLRLSLADQVNLKNPYKNIALGNLSIYYTCKNIKSAIFSSKLE